MLYFLKVTWGRTPGARTCLLGGAEEAGEGSVICGRRACRLRQLHVFKRGGTRGSRVNTEGKRKGWRSHRRGTSARRTVPIRPRKGETWSAAAASPGEIEGPEGWDAEHREGGFHFLLGARHPDPMEICEPVRPRQRVLAAETTAGNRGTLHPQARRSPGSR